MTTTDILKARLANKPGVIGATMITKSGRYFDFIDPQLEQIEITDIAWGLSNVCRFNGQCLDFYSVAQHSILVASAMPPEFAFQGLMHDAAEAYCGDMVGPLKQLIPEYKAIEKRIEAAIFAKFGLPTTLDPRIKHADLRLLRTEQRDLTAGHAESWNGLDDFPPLPERVNAWPPKMAYSQFMQRFNALVPS